MIHTVARKIIKFIRHNLVSDKPINYYSILINIKFKTVS